MIATISGVLGLDIHEGSLTSAGLGASSERSPSSTCTSLRCLDVVIPQTGVYAGKSVSGFAFTFRDSKQDTQCSSATLYVKMKSRNRCISKPNLAIPMVGKLPGGETGLKGMASSRNVPNHLYVFGTTPQDALVGGCGREEQPGEVVGPANTSSGEDSLHGVLDTYIAALGMTGDDVRSSSLLEPSSLGSTPAQSARSSPRKDATHRSFSAQQEDRARATPANLLTPQQQTIPQPDRPVDSARENSREHGEQQGRLPSAAGIANLGMYSLSHRSEALRLLLEAHKEAKELSEKSSDGARAGLFSEQGVGVGKGSASRARGAGPVRPAGTRTPFAPVSTPSRPRRNDRPAGTVKDDEYVAGRTRPSSARGHQWPDNGSAPSSRAGSSTPKASLRVAGSSARGIGSGGAGAGSVTRPSAVSSSSSSRGTPSSAIAGGARALRSAGGTSSRMLGADVGAHAGSTARGGEAVSKSSGVKKKQKAAARDDEDQIRELLARALEDLGVRALGLSGGAGSERGGAGGDLDAELKWGMQQVEASREMHGQSIGHEDGQAEGEFVGWSGPPAADPELVERGGQPASLDLLDEAAGNEAAGAAGVLAALVHGGRGNSMTPPPPRAAWVDAVPARHSLSPPPRPLAPSTGPDGHPFLYADTRSCPNSAQGQTSVEDGAAAGLTPEGWGGGAPAADSGDGEGAYGQGVQLAHDQAKFDKQMRQLEVNMAEISRSVILSPGSEQQQTPANAVLHAELAPTNDLISDASLTSLSLGASSSLLALKRKQGASTGSVRRGVVGKVPKGPGKRAAPGDDADWTDLPVALRSGNVKGRLERALRSNRELRTRNVSKYSHPGICSWVGRQATREEGVCSRCCVARGLALGL